MQQFQLTFYSVKEIVFNRLENQQFITISHLTQMEIDHKLMIISVILLSSVLIPEPLLKVKKKKAE